MKDGFKIGGIFFVQCFGPDGKLKWEDEAKNLMTNEGLDHVLDTVMHDATQVSTWYVGLKNTGDPAAGDTLASHTNWAENENYTGDRQEYVESAASSQAVTNSASKASFSITSDSQTISGAFLASASGVSVSSFNTSVGGGSRMSIPPSGRTRFCCGG